MPSAAARSTSSPNRSRVKAVPPMTLLVEVTARLRAVLGEQAGIALVLPDPTSLAASLGVPDATSWASRVLIEIIRSVGSVEPELVLFLGPEARVQPGIAGVCEFFGAQAVHLAAGAPGTLVLAGTASEADPAPPNEPVWLVTTAAEIPGHRGAGVPGTRAAETTTDVDRLRPKHFGRRMFWRVL